MTLKREKRTTFDSFEERDFYADLMLPKMAKDMAHLIPSILEVPVFSVSRGERGDVNQVWLRPGRGYIRYMGPPLTQSHLSVLLVLISARAGDIVTSATSFWPCGLLSSMRWADNSRNIERLTQLLDDLKRGQIRIWGEGEDEIRSSLRISFVDSFKPSLHEKWEVSLSRHLMPIFHGHLTRINLATRFELREGLASFLHGYISANSWAIPMSLETLHQASGSRYKSMKDFRVNVSRALAQLQEKGVIASFELSKSRIKIVKKKRGGDTID